MSNALKIAGALGAGTPAVTYVDDVFSAYTRSGTGASATINNGIDLSTKGGLVWTKARSAATNNKLTDTVRGATKALILNTTGSETTDTNGLTAFGTTGYTIGTDTNYNDSTGPVTYVDLTFRKAAKFFDIVTYTGNGANRTISHSLGIAPGMIIIKDTGATSPWTVYHASFANTEYAVLNTSAAKVTGATTYWNSTTATSSVFSLGTAANVNTNGNTYVAYLFAHDTATDGLIQCGSLTTDGSGNATVNLGWEPQYILFKRSSGFEAWYASNTSCGMSNAATSYMYVSTANAEASGSPAGLIPTAVGFNGNANALTASSTYIYLAIRRPNKPPTAGTQVYNAIARTGTGAAATVTGVGFAPDTVIPMRRDASYAVWYDRLRGGTLRLVPGLTVAETTIAEGVKTFGTDGITLGTESYVNNNASPIMNWFFKRAPGVFDIVCYAGTSANKTETHNLGVAPELWIVKPRVSAVYDWTCGCTALANTEYLALSTTAAKATDATAWNSTYPSSTVISLGTQAAVNSNNETYVAYLFATKAGISKVGSYTGNGSNLTLNMGFTTGARFFMCKRTDSTGDWFVWDSTRGIVAGNDPHLSLNTATAEVTTDDSVDPDNSGIIVNQLAATNINVNNATYIYLAFA